MRISVLLFLLASLQMAESMDQWGQEFLVTFISNYDQTGHNALYITARSQAASVQVDNQPFNVQQTFTVNAHTSMSLQLTAELQYTSENVTEDKAVSVLATSDISVYSINYRTRSSGMQVVYPTHTMGTHYLLAANTPLDNFAVTALYDNTTVQVELKLNGPGTCLNGFYANGDVVNAIIHSGQVWGFSCSADFTGSIITSNLPITVNAGMPCGIIPAGVPTCDHITEMLIPVEDMGNTHVLHDILYRQSGVIYRLISPYDNNSITDTDGQSGTLQKGEFLEYEVGGGQRDEMCVRSSKPVMTVMFTRGSDSDPSVTQGDPAMAVLPAVDSFTNEYVVNMEIKTGENIKRYMAITIATADVNGLSISGYVPPFFTAIGCGYSVGHVELDTKSHWLTHNSGAAFGVMLYASGDGIGLATPAGMSLTDKYDHCASEPCLNGATCFSNQNQSIYVCSCAAGYSGSECQTNINDCLPNPCGNGGSCVDGVNGYTCTCAAGYTGTTCNSVIPTTTSSSTLDTTSSSTPDTTSSSTPDTTSSSTPDTTSSSTPDTTSSSTPDTTSSSTPDTTSSSTLDTTSTVNTETTTQTEETTTPGAATTSGEATTPGEATTSGETTTSGEITTAAEAITVGETTSTNAALNETTPASRQCTCNCQAVSLGNRTMEELKQQAEEQAKEIKAELTMDKTTLSSTIRKVTSAPDNRPSATNMGFMGISFLVIIFGMIVLMDFTSFCRAAEKAAKDPSKQN